MAKKTWDTIVIVGVGLMGGSLGKAVLERKLAKRVIGVGRKLDRLKKAQKLGAITEASTKLDEAAAVADLIVVCTPVEEIFEHVAKASQHCRPGTLITDVGSTKSNLATAVAFQLQGRAANNVNGVFVGSHPIAGSEKSGVEHARGDLFEGKCCVVTPTNREPADAVSAVERFWKSIGMTVEQMDPREHDDAMAYVSHMPHVIAAILAAQTPAKYLKLAGSGFKDTTRIAAGDVELWRQILSDNRIAVAQSLHSFLVRLKTFQSALGTNDQETIVRQLTTGKKNRDALGN